MLEPETVDEAASGARDLARKWNLSQKPVDEWLADVQSGNLRTAATMRNALRPQVSLEILNSFDSKKPFYISLMISWYDSEFR